MRPSSPIPLMACLQLTVLPAGMSAGEPPPVVTEPPGLPYTVS
jgi:hypothetical protein